MGVTPRRLRAKDLHTPFRGVRAVPTAAAEPDDTPLARDRAARDHVLLLGRAYAEVMPPHAFFVGRTAAVALGLPTAHGEDLEVGVLAPSRAPRRAGVRGIKVAPTLVSVRKHEGLRMSSPASTWAMLARECSVRELIVIGDAVVRVPRDRRGDAHPERALATIEQLRSAAAAGPRRGVQRLREALERIRVGSASPLETEFRLDAEDAGLPTPELDVPIRDANGRLLGISEIVYRELRIVVEIEGDHHRTSRAQWNRDLEKYAAYAAAGWEVVRLTSTHVRGAKRQGVSITHDALRRRGWQP
ncbi:MAG: hypothetical protein QM611_11810 [Microbacterium sp.]|uniref:hypothetical protein n=1 Tax=Microbacterium sp. TaxID=51671 RepID=UPI0039E590CB